MSTLSVQNITDGTITKTATDVLNSSNRGLGEIGTYAFVTRLGGTLLAGTDYSGAVLAYSGATYNNGANVTLLKSGTGTVGVGTWRAMGSSNGSPDNITLVLRIA
jgi:hypothetical protein